MRAARAVMARPRTVIALWSALIVLLAVQGIGVEDRLHGSSLEVPGSASHANRERSEHFGDGAPMTVVLRGPAADVRAQGTQLARRIERLPRTVALDPWRGGSTRTAGSRQAGVIVVRQEADAETQARDTVPAVRKMVAELRAPVRGHLTGISDVGNGINESSFDALTRAEIIAAPLLLLVLLLVFRSVVAAGLPLLLGLMTIAAARGTIGLVNEVVELDAIALSIGSMLGLALGVDYALLIVSRFREELDAGRSPIEAAVEATSKAGHTVLVAGAALLVSLLASFALSPGSLLVAGATGASVAAILSMGGAVTFLPALLSLLGTRIDRWSFGAPRAARGEGAAGRLALAALGRPRLAAALVGGLLLLLAAPALGLQTGPPDVRTLPASALERRDYEAIRSTLGPGWMAPFDIVVTADRGSITDPARLRALGRLQDRLIRHRGVETVIGPAELRAADRELQRIPDRFDEARAALRDGQRDQQRLEQGMRRVGSGIATLRAGLDDAAAGASALRDGGARSADGTARLTAGIDRARRGASTIVEGLDRADDGARALEAGVGRAGRGLREVATGLDALRTGAGQGRDGARELAGGLRTAQAGATQLREPAQRADAELRRALRELDRMAPTSKIDPSYRRLYEAVGTAQAAVSGRDPRTGAAVRPGYDGLDAGLAELAGRLGDAVAGADRLATGIDALQQGVGRLDRGVGALRSGSTTLRRSAAQLAAGLAALGRGGGDLESGLGRLRAGAAQLDAGARSLRGGADRLAGGLRDGSSRSAELTDGVDRIASGVAGGERRTRELEGRLRATARISDLTRSGHLLLAAIDSAPAADRRAARLVVNVDRGGDAADIIVVPRTDESHDGAPLRAVLEREAARFERDSGLHTSVGGAAAALQDFDRVSGERLLPLIVALVLLTLLALTVIFRSVILAAIAVGLNVATVLAAFGVLALLFQGDAPLLGGPGFLDAIITLGMLSIVFGLSIDYAVFIISRMREGFALTGDPDEAIRYGIRGTARIITGAATIMSGAFIALALADISTLRQFGVGLTVAVLLDATLVRLILLPAAVKLAAPRAWRTPRLLAPRGGRTAGAADRQPSPPR